MADTPVMTDTTAATETAQPATVNASNFADIFDIDTDTPAAATDTTTAATDTPTTENPADQSAAKPDEAAAKPETEVKKDEGTTEPETKATEHAAKAEDEVTQLRAMVREQSRRLRELQKVIDASNKELTEKGLIDAVDEDVRKAQAESDTIRSTMLETILETMRVNPKYADIDSVATQTRFNDLVDSYAHAIAKEKGGNAEDYIDSVAAEIWKMPNPYRFMYEKIKEHHPDFAKTATPDASTASGDPKQEDTKRQPTPKTSPDTLSDIPATSADSGWTSAKIDAMSEEDLGKVPRDVYNSYLAGTLK